ncbi:hypothetical protein [Methylocucumis oryzae]|uniref:Uncharacterized protein n=1 Tax=Methylocucumis oryzae TaxID=1632867 RepID=A0A0F3IR77_9GAMM|nr:hypothetical protein [Methylocucumis oryzae]KJV08094.1 hypothetical protein VZ94_00615 [Methylocucumis oryzae]
MATYDAQILQRRDTAANWHSANPILEPGEVGYEIVPDYGDKMKVGDGITAWDDLPYAYAGLGSNTFTGAQNEAHGDPVASASTVNLNTATGNFVEITGTTQINLITLSDGFERTVRFSGVLTLKHGTKLILLGGENIITAPGDVAIFRGDAANAVQMVAYSRADGKALKETTVASSIYNKRGHNIASAASIRIPPKITSRNHLS